MAKTLRQFIKESIDFGQNPPTVGGYYPKRSKDEQHFVAKHVIQVWPDRAGNGDDIFKGTNVKYYDRKTPHHGYNPGDDEAVYD